MQYIFLQLAGNTKMYENILEWLSFTELAEYQRDKIEGTVAWWENCVMYMDKYFMKWYALLSSVWNKKSLEANVTLKKN